MTDIATETPAQRARRLGKEYVDAHYKTWNRAGRQWLKYAFARGYQQACIDQAAEAEAALEAVNEWEATGDDEKLINEHIDPWIDRVLDRVKGVKQ